MNNTIVKNRHEFMMLAQAVMCNPGGEIDMNNLPRQDPITGIGFITDVNIKRGIRNYVHDAFKGPGMEIMIQQGVSLNKLIAEAVLEANGTDMLPKNFTNQKIDESARILAKRYWDVRTFGGVMNSGLKAGQIKGAVQIGMATSFDPIQPTEISITRMAYADGKDGRCLADYEREEAERPEDKKRTIGTKTFIPYGLYLITGTVSAPYAEAVGFTEDDLAALWEALLQMYSHNVSSSKEGMSPVSPLIIFKHVGTQPEANVEQNAREARLGCASLHKLTSLLKVHKKEGVETPRSLEDYDIAFNLSGLPAGVEVGVKDTPFGEVRFDKHALANWTEAKIL